MGLRPLLPSPALAAPGEPVANGNSLPRLTTVTAPSELLKCEGVGLGASPTPSPQPGLCWHRGGGAAPYPTQGEPLRSRTTCRRQTATSLLQPPPNPGQGLELLLRPHSPLPYPPTPAASSGMPHGYAHRSPLPTPPPGPHPGLGASRAAEAEGPTPPPVWQGGSSQLIGRRGGRMVQQGPADGLREQPEAGGEGAERERPHEQA